MVIYLRFSYHQRYQIINYWNHLDYIENLIIDDEMFVFFSFSVIVYYPYSKLYLIINYFRDLICLSCAIRI